MIVETFFDGDHGQRAWQQHDCYEEALGRIIWGCKEHFERAALMLETRFREDWAETPLDPRLLQMPHDLLAATWRFGCDPAQLGLFDDPAAARDGWLDWLEEEVDAWWKQPSLVRDVRICVDRQGQTAGRFASTSLARRLMKRHDQVPWVASLRTAIEQEYRTSFSDATKPTRE